MNTILLTSNIAINLPKIRWVIVLLLLVASLAAPGLAHACGTNSGSCGG